MRKLIFVLSVLCMGSVFAQKSKHYLLAARMNGFRAYYTFEQKEKQLYIQFDIQVGKTAFTIEEDGVIRLFIEGEKEPIDITAVKEVKATKGGCRYGIFSACGNGANASYTISQADFERLTSSRLVAIDIEATDKHYKRDISKCRGWKFTKRAKEFQEATK